MKKIITVFLFGIVITSLFTSCASNCPAIRHNHKIRSERW